MPVKLMRALNAAPLVTKRHHLIGKVYLRRSDLTPNRLKVLELMAQGLSNEEIAERLEITKGAATDRVKHVLKALDARNRPNAVHLAHRSGILDGIPPGPERDVFNWSGAEEWNPGRIEVLRHLAEGVPTGSIAKAMGLRGGVGMTRDRLRSAYHLLGATTAANAVHRAHLRGLLGWSPSKGEIWILR